MNDYIEFKEIIGNVDSNRNYYIYPEDNSLIEILKEGGMTNVNLIKKEEIISGYYINIDGTVIMCENGVGCQEALLVNICNDENLGKVVKESNNNIYLCSSEEINESGIYLTRNSEFPGSNQSYIYIEYNSIKGTILEFKQSQICEEDGKVIYKNGIFYYCTEVIIEENVGENEITKETVSYNEIPMNSENSSFVLKLEEEYKVVNIANNGIVTFNYGKY